MPQICGWFSDTQYTLIKEQADKEGISLSKCLSSLVDDALYKRYETAELKGEIEHITEQVMYKDKQIAACWTTLDKYTNEIIPPLKLLVEGTGCAEQERQEKEKEDGLYARFIHWLR